MVLKKRRDTDKRLLRSSKSPVREHSTNVLLGWRELSGDRWSRESQGFLSPFFLSLSPSHKIFAADGMSSVMFLHQGRKNPVSLLENPLPIPPAGAPHSTNKTSRQHKTTQQIMLQSHSTLPGRFQNLKSSSVIHEYFIAYRSPKEFYYRSIPSNILGQIVLKRAGRLASAI